jgi:hypothetical protein
MDLLDLPHEIIWHILQNLTLKDLINNVRKTSLMLRNLSREVIVAKFRSVVGDASLVIGAPHRDGGMNAIALRGPTQNDLPRGRTIVTFTPANGLVRPMDLANMSTMTIQIPQPKPWTPNYFGWPSMSFVAAIVPGVNNLFLELEYQRGRRFVYNFFVQNNIRPPTSFLFPDYLTTKMVFDAEEGWMVFRRAKIEFDFYRYLCQCPFTQSIDLLEIAFALVVLVGGVAYWNEIGYCPISTGRL